MTVTDIIFHVFVNKLIHDSFEPWMKSAVHVNYLIEYVRVLNISTKQILKILNFDESKTGLVESGSIVEPANIWTSLWRLPNLFP